jgi:hypothetical protein
MKSLSFLYFKNRGEKMKQITMSLLASTAILFTACGGGGDDTTIVPNTNQYDLRTFMDTSSYTVTGEGTAITPNGTFDLTGTYKSSYQGTSVVGSGETVHHHDVTMLLTVVGVGTISQNAESSTYVGNIIRTNNLTEGVICEATLPLPDLTPIPTDAQVGYISDVVSLQCDDGSYATRVIKLNDAGGGNAEISVISNMFEYQGGTLLGSETDNVIVTPSMSMVNVEISGYDVSTDTTVTLNSTSITQP